MAERHRVGIVGTGRPWKSEGATGFGMAHIHARGFLASGRCDIAAAADINRENAEEFRRQFGGMAIYTDYRRMLADEALDIVSVCTWPKLHAPIVMAAIEAGVKAVYCEKPMALTWGESCAMHNAAVASGVMLAFNHQRRFLAPFQQSKRLLGEGAIGKLLRLEGQCENLYDWGTHWLDMFCFYNDEVPAEWVLAQIDSRTGKEIFGAPVEDQAVCHFQFRNGVRATLTCGFGSDIGCANRLIGDRGVIEVGWHSPWIRMWRPGLRDWKILETAEGIHDPVAIERAIADFLRALDTGGRSLLSSFHAVQATEIIFAAYESSRRRGRVDLPLTADDSALATMRDSGDLGPRVNAGRGSE